MDPMSSANKGAVPKSKSGKEGAAPSLDPNAPCAILQVWLLRCIAHPLNGCSVAAQNSNASSLASTLTRALHGCPLRSNAPHGLPRSSVYCGFCLPHPESHTLHVENAPLPVAMMMLPSPPPPPPPPGTSLRPSHSLSSMQPIGFDGPVDFAKHPQWDSSAQKLAILPARCSICIIWISKTQEVVKLDTNMRVRSRSHSRTQRPTVYMLGFQRHPSPPAYSLFTPQGSLASNQAATSCLLR